MQFFFGLRSGVVGVACAMVVGMGAGTAWGQSTVFVRVVDKDLSPEDDSWAGANRKMILLGPTGESISFPAGCGALGGQTYPLARAVVVQPGAGALTSLTIAAQLPSHAAAGSRLTFISSDSQQCCTDTDDVLVACPDPAAATSFRRFIGTLNANGSFHTGMPLAAVRAVPVGSADDWSGSDRQIISLGGGETMTCPDGAGDLAGVDLIDHGGVVARLSDGSAEQCSIRFFEDVPAGVVISNIDSDTVLAVTDEYGWAVDADDPYATTEWRLITGEVTGLPNDGQLNSGDWIVAVRVVEKGAVPEGVSWVGSSRRIVVIGSSSYEPLQFVPGCGAVFGGLTAFTHDGVVTNSGQGGGGALHLRDNLFFFEPVPPGTIVEMINSDTEECCLDANGFLYSCSPHAPSVTSIRLFYGFVH